MNPLTPALESPIPTLNLNGDLGSTNLALVPYPAPGSQVPAPRAASIQPVVTVSPPAPPILKGRPRTGAVASLPKDYRDMACRMIAQSVPYKKIAEALDQLGFVVTERNISNWVTHGGYAEWCALFDESVQTALRQDDLLEHHRNENSPDLAEVGLQSAAVRLSEFLLRQMASNQDLEANFSKFEPAVRLLCRVNKELFTAQKYRDDCLTRIFETPARTKAKKLQDLALAEYCFSTDPEELRLKLGRAKGANGSPVTQAAPAAQPPVPPTPAPTQSTSAPAAAPQASPLGQPSPTAGSSSGTAPVPSDLEGSAPAPGGLTGALAGQESPPPNT